MLRAPRTPRTSERVAEQHSAEGVDVIRVNGNEIQRSDVNALANLEDAIVRFAQMSEPLLDRRDDAGREPGIRPDYSEQVTLLTEANSRVMNMIGLPAEHGESAVTDGSLDNIDDKFLHTLVTKFSEARYNYELPSDTYDDNLTIKADELVDSLKHFQNGDKSLQVAKNLIAK